MFPIGKTYIFILLPEAGFINGSTSLAVQNIERLESRFQLYLGHKHSETLWHCHNIYAFVQK